MLHRYVEHSDACRVYGIFVLIQVMSSTVADALTFDDNDETTETILFIRLFEIAVQNWRDSLTTLQVLVVA